MGKSPCGQFGFSVDTHLANVPVDNTWASSWEVFFAQQMRSLLNKEETLHGPDAEYKQLKDEFFDIVIPSLDSDAVCMFDSCAYWGHNEADLAICRNPRYRLGKSYINEYLKQIPASEPTEDFEGRNAVYAMKYHVLLSIMYFKDKRFHKIAIEEMESLKPLSEKITVYTT
ncbi:hypothetical protein MGN70_000320 [Eutypa lata]|nr:hypothetical protein MGN70_000320 [Eutypa lata]